jgi:hypothetical protein
LEAESFVDAHGTRHLCRTIGLGPFEGHAHYFLIRRIALILAAKPITIVIDRKLRSRGCGIACGLALTHLHIFLRRKLVGPGLYSVVGHVILGFEGN